MASANLGRVSIVAEGEYTSTQNYARLSLVTYEGYPYLAKVDVPAGNLPTDELYWMPLLTDLDFAPGGYGLGSTGGYHIDDCNQATTIGWYYLSGGSTLNIPDEYKTMGYGSLRVERRSSYITQTNIFMQYSAVRYSNDSGATWSGWEWVNPPMSLGVEYRTTERWQGKAVYCKLVDLRTLPDSASSEKDIVFFAGSMAELVSVDVSVHAGTTWRTEDTRWSKYVYTDSAGAHIVIKATENVSGYSGFAVFKYTKN